jgi:SAM-dependent methyltransferase
MKVLEIGVGLHARPDTTVGIDKVKTFCTDIVRDVAKKGIPFNDDWFDKVNAFDVLEHIESYEDLIFMINEIWRVLKPDGMFEFTTVSGISGLGHISHHRTFFVESFDYLKVNTENEDYNHMRESDGIVANFELNFDSSVATGWLYGKFKAIK